MENRIGLSVVIFSCLLLVTLGCSSNRGKERVVIYTSVDQVFSEPILNQFQEQTGVEVLPVYDVEAAKTTGLVNRLIAEKDNPQADVFWNGEFAQTLLLKEEGVLTPYQSPQAENIPPAYKDIEHYWTGFSGRARVLIINTHLLSPEDYPSSIYSLLDPKWEGDQIGFAYPLFGTTATHAAALYALWGEQEAVTFFQNISQRNIQVVDGNSVVRDQVVRGELLYGLTDTDDACTALQQGAPVEVIFPDQKQGEMGTLIIPNTVALIKGGPHPENGKKLIDFLLSEETSLEMMKREWTHLPLRPLPNPSACYPDLQVKGLNLPLEEIYQQLVPAKTQLTEIFIR